MRIWLLTLRIGSFGDGFAGGWIVCLVRMLSNHVAWCRSPERDIHEIAMYLQALAPPRYRPWPRSKEQIEFSKHARILNTKSCAAFPNVQNKAMCAFCASIDHADCGAGWIEPHLFGPIFLEGGKADRPCPVTVGTMGDGARGISSRGNRIFVLVLSCRVVMHGKFPSLNPFP